MSWVRGVMAGLGSIALACAAIGQPSGGPPPAKVVVDGAQMQRVEGLREVTGALRAVKRSLIASEEAGLITGQTLSVCGNVEWES